MSPIVSRILYAPFDDPVVRLVLLVSCQSEDEQIRDVVRNFVAADMVQAAPHRAFIYLASSDQRHTTPEEFATRYANRIPFPEATFTIDAIEQSADRANVTVTLSEGPGSDDLSTIFVVRMDQNDGAPRVYLGLKEITEIRAKLDKARRLADDGGLEDAKELLEQVDAAPFRGSRPEIYEKEIEKTKKAVKFRESRKSLDKRIGDAMKMNVDDLEQEIAALEKLIPEDDEEMNRALEKLRRELTDRVEVAALENFVFTNIRIPKILGDNGSIVRTVTFKARNNTQRPLSALKVDVKFVNEAGGDPFGLASFDLIAKGKIMEPQAVIPFERIVKNTPENWRGREIEVVATDLVFADGK